MGAIAMEMTRRQMFFLLSRTSRISGSEISMFILQRLTAEHALITTFCFRHPTSQYRLHICVKLRSTFNNVYQTLFCFGWALRWLFISVVFRRRRTAKSNEGQISFTRVESINFLSVCFVYVFLVCHVLFDVGGIVFCWHPSECHSFIACNTLNKIHMRQA